MILVAVFGPYVEDRIGGIDTIIVFVFSASMGLIMYTVHIDLLWDAQSVVRGSSGGTIAFAGIGISVIIDNMTDINWTLSSIISLIIIIHFELLKVIGDPSIFSSSYPVMSAHVGGLIFGYILIIIINREGRYKSESSGRYDKL
jgi:membrane associated rhomboid family serine protease